MYTNKLVFEIGVEEIPAQYIKTMAGSLKSNAIEMFKSLRLNYSELNVCYTPRRFVLIVDDLEACQPSIIKVVKGPAVNVAFEADGKTPTRALCGFMNKCSKGLEDIVLENDGKREYVTVQVAMEGEKAIDLLAEPLAVLVGSIYCPNSMRWGNYPIKFIRPIRWLMAYYGNTPLAVQIECVAATSLTYGHRTLADGQIAVASAEDYFDALEKGCVILSEKDRKNSILAQIAELERDNGFRVELDDNLLEQVANIVEYPTCAVGHFEEEYLALPECIIKNPLKTQQFYFPVYRNGKIDNTFIYVRNGGTYFIENVTRGNERVLRPRLADAQFFYENDCKYTLKELANQLDDVVFIDQAGSYKDKTNRVKAMALKLATLVGYEDTDKLVDTISVLKADLVSSVVREYTDIQGIIGGVYANNDGYSADVCTAISEQYLPNYLGDDLPSSKLSAVISIADKLDTIMTLCAVGLKPSSSSDPYGLRRQTLGIFLAALNQGLDIDLRSFIEESNSLYESFYTANDESSEKYLTFLHNFFFQRLRVFLHEIKAISLSDINKISIDELNISKSMKKAETIAGIENADWYQQFVMIFNRIQRLIKGVQVNNFFDCSIQDEEAAEMFRIFRVKRGTIISLIDEENYSEAIRIIADCSLIITTFMEEHLALCDDVIKRNNRIAFFSDFCAICGRIIQLGQ
jgi:glycyl-tRNA synthetase beta chain